MSVQRPFLSFCTGLLLALALSVPAWGQGAPPGWELRNDVWVPLVEPGSDSPEGQVSQMIQDLRQGRPSVVVKAAKDWVKRNGTHPLMPQVLLLHGDAEVLRGNKYAALYPYEDLLNNFPTSDLYLPVLEREYQIADAFLRGYKRKFLGMRILPVVDDALQLLDRIQDRQRGSAVAEQAGLRVADHHYSSGRFQQAIDAYTDFLRRYPFSQYVGKAEVRRTEALLGNFRGVRFDFTTLDDARRRLAAVAETMPQAAEDLQARAIDDRIYQLEGEKELEIARYYFRAGKKYASAYYYRRVIEYWPETDFANAARKELAARLGATGGRP